uniref:Putative cobalamin biosynthesis protein n=1 Tax=uncultured proteobacterium RedeBAC7D11 TaxID=295350 RepID=Q5UF54_9PROT|nr:putative cobalamin biosynthesis protein [uncultured proteobacterium RedeBAC7D11]
MSQKSTEQNVKDVINASSRAISKDKDLSLEVNYIQQVAEPGHNLQENIESIQLSRGDADRQALLQKYKLLEKPLKRTGISELDFLLKDFEAVRSEILGSKEFLGVKQNLRNLFLKNLSQQTIESKQDALKIAVEISLKNKLLKQKNNKLEEVFLKPWEKALSEVESDFKLAEKYLTDKEKFNEYLISLFKKLGFEFEEPEQEEPKSDTEEENEDNEEDGTSDQEQEDQPDNDASEVDDESETEIEDFEIEEGDVDDTEDWVENRSKLEELIALNQNQEYKVFCRDFDEVVDADNLCSSEELKRLRDRLDQLIDPSKSVVAKLANRLQRLLLAQQRRSWEFDKEEGILDSSKLHKIITDPLTPLSFKTEKETSFKDTVLTMLVDSSGSMRGRSMTTAAISADIIGSTLDKCNIKTEILGFTTKHWKGGDSRKLWVECGKPSSPGRLNDLRHIIFKPADLAWRRAKKNLGLMLREGLLKENVDGEALLWASSRLMKRPEQRKILMVISDGAPVDDSTLSTNSTSYLDNHLKQVISEIENRTELELIAIGIGHDVTKYYKKAVTIHRAEELGNVMLEQLTDLFQEK